MNKMPILVFNDRMINMCNVSFIERREINNSETTSFSIHLIKNAGPESAFISGGYDPDYSLEQFFKDHLRYLPEPNWLGRVIWTLNQRK